MAPWVKGRQLWEMASDLCGVDTAGHKCSVQPVYVHGTGADVGILFFWEEGRSLCSTWAEPKFWKRSRNPLNISVSQPQPPNISSAVHTVLASFPTNNFDPPLKRKFEGLKLSFGKWKILSGPARSDLLLLDSLHRWNKLGHDVANCMLQYYQQ